MKTLVAFTLTLVFATVGCASHPSADLRPLVAVSGYYGILSAPAKPKPGVCPECRGTGRVGDGVVFSTCKACGGTGKTPVSVLAPKPTCKDGKCAIPR